MRQGVRIALGTVALTMVFGCSAPDPGQYPGQGSAGQATGGRASNGGASGANGATNGSGSGSNGSGSSGSGSSGTGSSGTGSSGTGSDGSGSNGGSDGSGNTGSGTGSDGSGNTGSSGAIQGPADLFPSDSVWYRDVSSLAVAPQSSGIIGAIGSWGTGRFMIDFSIVVLHANASTPRESVDIEWPEESDVQPVPVPASGSLEGEDGYACTTGGDCHLIVVDDSKRLLFELWSTTNTPSWKASQETVWDLTKHYGPEGRGLGCTSADAAGLSVMAGLIGLRETKAGDIRHALRFILPNSKIRKGPSFVAPATHGTSATSSNAGPPYGTRLRLKPSYDESKITSTGGRAVVRALKTYGMILADGGNYALTGEDEKIEHARDPSMTWDGVLGAADLAAIAPADFDVVDFGAIDTAEDCTRAP